MIILLQNAGFGTEVLNVDATDRDTGANADIVYRLVNIGGINSPFSLDPTSGSLTVDGTLDRETTAQYSVSCLSSRELLIPLL